MLSRVLEQWLQTTVFVVKDLSGKNLQYLSALCILSTCLLLWRIWAFTVLPALQPDEPKELPYWVPCKPGEMAMTLYMC